VNKKQVDVRDQKKDLNKLTDEELKQYKKEMDKDFKKN